MKRLKRLKTSNKRVFRAFKSRHYEHENINIKSICNIVYIVKNMFIAFIAFILKIAYSAKNAFIVKNAFGCNSEKINNLLWRIFPKK